MVMCSGTIGLPLNAKAIDWPVVIVGLCMRSIFALSAHHTVVRFNSVQSATTEQPDK